MLSSILFGFLWVYIYFSSFIFIFVFLVSDIIELYLYVSYVVHPHLL